MKNLEIKVKVSSLESIKESLSFATFSGNLHQKDTYYLVGERRLKLREQKNLKEIIYYTRQNKKNTRESKYFRLTVPQLLLSSVKNFLSFLFKEKTVVEKERNLYLYKHTRIHLDDVKRLGSFVELETVFSGRNSTDSLLKEHEEVKNKLKLESFQSIPGSYSDLLHI